MIREKVGQVSITEKNEVLRLHERILALKEVSLTVDNIIDNEEKERLVKKINIEFATAEKVFSDWWQSKANKYSWKKDQKGRWAIDFNNNDIYLEIVD